MDRVAATRVRHRRAARCSSGRKGRRRRRASPPASELDFLLTKAFEERSDISIRDGTYSGTATLIGRDEDSDRPGIVRFHVTWDVVENDDNERTRMERLARAR